MATVRSLIGSVPQNVVTIDRDRSVHETMGLMVEYDIGAVIITEDGKPVGLFTERDVLKCWARKEDTKYFKEIKVSDAMTTNLIIAEPDDDLCYVSTVMIKNRIRHLPVVKEHKIVGMLSIRDVVKAQVLSLQSENHYLKEYLAGDYPG
ncbi:MAG: CBS domain-containing protein [Nitrospirae bacterium]|nr:CBS domain-containing protein [Nitrospirota bacterium]